MVLTLLDKDENVDREAASEDHNSVKDGSPGQNNAALAKFVSEEFVIKGRKAEVGVVLHLVQALGASVDSGLRQTH